ncbi:MAG: GGDEF domain-containing protein [Desulfobacteraceae bacterium]|nr:GGDEF domain-containing protein [Desulfobacteraceae bacterium]
MKLTLEKITNNLSALFSVIFTSAAKQASIHNKLSRHIVALNKKTSSEEIINEVAVCLKDILDYRLFAFVVKKKDGVDVWLDPRMYKKSLEDIILKDFKIGQKDLNYLNQNFEPDELQEEFSMENLVYYELNEENCCSRLYMLPKKSISSFHNEVANLILQGCATALSKQIKMENLRDAAVIDPLTGCYNRREFENQINRHIATAARHKKQLSLFMFDLDYFKKVNDTHGHLGGDLVLKKISFLVKDNMRKEDILARYGGEEFVAILPETDKNKAMELADRLRSKIADIRIPHNGSTIRVTASFGVSELTPNADMNKIIQDADTMLYRAKVNGRNRVMPGLIKICSPKKTKLQFQNSSGGI